MVLVLATAAGCRGGAAQAPRFDGEAALRRVEHMVAAGARVPNSTAHRAIGDWIVQELRARADSVEEQAFSYVTQQGDTLRLRNILARFRPDAGERVLFVSHWDSRPTADQETDPARRALPVPGADDGGSSAAVLLGIADALKVQPPAVGVDLLFTDGEDWGDFDGPDVLIGAKHFAANLPSGYRPLYGVLFDLVGGRDVTFAQEGYSLDRAPEVVERVWEAAREIGLGRMFRHTSGGYVTDDHVPLLGAGIRIVNVIASPLPSYWHTLDDTPDKLSARSLAAVGSLALYLVR
jgi:hypothetical protein